MELRAPFPWFGGKSRVAGVVWARFGQVANYVEPFFGSGAVLLGRPGGAAGVETVNDRDGFVCNFWRALQADPAGLAALVDWPVFENDLHARHAALVQAKCTLWARLEGDPAYFDVQIAAWWVWGVAAWIGTGWCSGRGPWRVVDGRLVRMEEGGGDVERKLPHLGDAGRGVYRQVPHLGPLAGVHRQVPHLGDSGRGVHKPVDLATYLGGLSERLRRVRVVCGDWRRCVGGKAALWGHGVTGVFLDPPYSGAERDGDMYAAEDAAVAAEAAQWAREHGGNPKLRIALCGYEGEHVMPDGWTCHAWSARGGYGSQGEGRGAANRHRERIWFSPHCRQNGGQMEFAV